MVCSYHCPNLGVFLAKNFGDGLKSETSNNNLNNLRLTQGFFEFRYAPGVWVFSDILTRLIANIISILYFNPANKIYGETG